jgi:hypothetical protein
VNEELMDISKSQNTVEGWYFTNDDKIYWYKLAD